MALQAKLVFRRLVETGRVHGPPALHRARHGLAALASTGGVVARDALQRARDARNDRQARPRHSAAPRPGRAARRAWLAQLNELGRPEVADLLDRTSSPHAGPTDIVRFIDAGIAHGRTRYPTRQFVLDWLNEDDAPADVGLWRVSAIVVISFALLSMGMLTIFV